MKDSFDVAGMRTTGGLMHRRDLVQEKICPSSGQPERGGYYSR